MEQRVTYGSLQIGEQFKFELSNAWWYKKIKLGRKHVYIRLDGHFTFLPPIGAKRNLLVFKKQAA